MEFFRLFLKKPDAQLEKGLRGFRAIALLSVFSKWYTTVRVDLLREEKEPIEWRSLHVGAERGVNCEHVQASVVTSIFQRHWKWQEDRRTDLQPGFYRYNTTFMASLDVKTAFVVARPAVVSKTSHLDRSSRECGGCLAGRDAGCSRLGLLRKQ